MGGRDERGGEQSSLKEKGWGSQSKRTMNGGKVET